MADTRKQHQSDKIKRPVLPAYWSAGLTVGAHGRLVRGALGGASCALPASLYNFADKRALAVTCNSSDEQARRAFREIVATFWQLRDYMARGELDAAAQQAARCEELAETGGGLWSGLPDPQQSAYAYADRMAKAPWPEEMPAHGAGSAVFDATLLARFWGDLNIRLASDFASARLAQWQEKVEKKEAANRNAALMEAAFRREIGWRAGA